MGLDDDTRDKAGKGADRSGSDGISRQPTRDAGAAGRATVVDGHDVEARIEAAVSKLGPDSDEDHDPLIGKLIDNRFEVLSRLGAGGMGIVYRARQTGIDRIVAIKTLLKDRAQDGKVVMRFKNEARAVSKLNHPNTIRIHDFGQMDDGTLYFAMELLEGRPLDRAIRQDGPFSARRTLHVMIQMAESLAEAHSKGIVHRDLKPENVYLCPVGDDPDFVKVLDFGVARMKQQDTSQGTMTQAGVIFGTPRYMAPEQARTMAVDARADIYALGVIWFEMLVGKTPFDADNPLAILMKHIQDAVPAMKAVRPDVSVPSDVEAMVRKCLEKSADKRFQSAAALAAEARSLNDRLDGRFERVVFVDKPASDVSPSSSPVIPDPSRELAPVRRRKPAALAAVIVVLALLGTGAGIGLATMLRDRGATVSPDLVEPPPETVEAAVVKSTPEPVMEPVPEPVAAAVTVQDVLENHGSDAIEEPLARMVQVRVESVPPGASVMYDDVELGKTPLDVELPGDDAESVFILVADGFKDAPLTATLDRDLTLSATMAKLPPKKRAARRGNGHKSSGRSASRRKKTAPESVAVPEKKVAPVAVKKQTTRSFTDFKKIKEKKPAKKVPNKVGDLKKF